jgi:hypothetical protein
MWVAGSGGGLEPPGRVVGLSVLAVGVVVFAILGLTQCGADRPPDTFEEDCESPSNDGFNAICSEL